MLWTVLALRLLGLASDSSKAVARRRGRLKEGDCGNDMKWAEVGGALSRKLSRGRGEYGGLAFVLRFQAGLQSHQNNSWDENYVKYWLLPEQRWWAKL